MARARDSFATARPRTRRETIGYPCAMPSRVLPAAPVRARRPARPHVPAAHARDGLVALDTQGPRQALSRLGLFNPLPPGRLERVRRNHRLWLGFLCRAGALAHLAEGDLAKAPQLAHHRRIALRVEEVDLLAVGLVRDDVRLPGADANEDRFPYSGRSRRTCTELACLPRWRDRHGSVYARISLPGARARRAARAPARRPTRTGSSRPRSTRGPA